MFFHEAIYLPVPCELFFFFFPDTELLTNSRDISHIGNLILTHLMPKLHMTIPVILIPISTSGVNILGLSDGTKNHLQGDL